MKKTVCVLLTLCLCACMLTGIAAEGDMEKSYAVGKALSDKGSFFKLDGVDLTSVKSIRVKADTFSDCMLKITADKDSGGTVLAWLKLCEEGVSEYGCNIREVSGVHDVYIVLYFGSATPQSLTFSKEVYQSPYVMPGDDAIVDNFSDTWVSTDDMGREVADFEEVGPVKEGSHDVGMMYWPKGDIQGLVNARIPSEIVAEHPEAKDDYYHAAWDTTATYFWSEPLFGFYEGSYWLYRRHAVMLADAGVDVLFFDWSNGDSIGQSSLNVLCRAFADAKADGVRVPRLNALNSWFVDKSYRRRQLINIYVNFIDNERYRDLWYQWDGKPLMFGNSSKWSTDLDNNDPDERAKLLEIFEACTFRESGTRQPQELVTGDRYWHWLQASPLTKWNVEEDGRTEFMVVGTAVNESTVYGWGKTGVCSDPFSKGRGYSEAFGEDYRPEGKRLAYFFREEAAQALREDPAFLMIDGWNEWAANRNASYSGYPNSFVDTYDDEDSRDFEPSAGVLGDDYYNLLVDFIRKYKGVRKAPLASAEKTIDLSGDAQQWDDVMPLFVNDYLSQERDDSTFKNAATGDPYHYVTTLTNVIRSAKLARDSENFYLRINMDKPVSDISKLHVYFNTDRNHATGWQGYDFAVNLDGQLGLSAYDGQTWQTIGTAAFAISDKAVAFGINRALLGKQNDIELEFKIADGAEENGDLLRFYQFGSVAPLGRFNYLYTEKEQVSLDQSTRQALSDSAILKAGSNNMVVSGGKMHVYEADIRVTPFEEAGTLYVPEVAVEEILGYGETKCAYYEEDNAQYISHCNRSGIEIVDDIWSYTIVGSQEVHINGRLMPLSHPVKVVDGIRYIPLSYLSDVFGWSLTADNGVYTLSKTAVDAQSAAKAAALL